MRWMLIVMSGCVLSLALAGCASGPKRYPVYDAMVGEYKDVRTPEQFWVRTAQIKLRSEGKPTYGEYSAYWNCAGKKMVELSPAHLTDTIAKFTQTHMYVEYNAAVQEANIFLADYKKNTGKTAADVAQASCENESGT